MVGLALAAQLADSDLQVVVLSQGRVHRELPEVTDCRVSALNVTSQRLLQRVNAWSKVQSERVCEYTNMQVWEKDSFARIDFSAADTEHAALGCIVENQNIVNALYAVVKGQPNTTIIEDFQLNKIESNDSSALLLAADQKLVSARLVVGADGANSTVRRLMQTPMTFWQYDQSAIVATVKTQQPHQQTARQAFTATGPLAFLPLSAIDQCSIVWSQDTQYAEDLMGLPEHKFCQRLATHLDMQLGQCELLNSRHCIPLTMRYVRQWVSNRAVLIGDAAHTIHPLAGQGVNLGFQDSIALAEAIVNIPIEDLGAIAPLRAFERDRKAAAVKMIATMEGFKRGFSGSQPVIKLIRGLGMAGANELAPAKRFLMQQALGD